MNVYAFGMRAVKADALPLKHMYLRYSAGMGSAELHTVEVVPSTYEDRARTRIKHWLHSTNMTQTQLGEQISRNQEWMSRYLSGKINADLATLEQMAGVFGHSLSALLDLPRDPQHARLIDLYDALPPRSRTSFLDFLAGLRPAPRRPNRG